MSAEKNIPTLGSSQIEARVLATCTEVAEMIGITPRTVRKHAANLGFQRTGRDWWFTASQIEMIRGRRGLAGWHGQYTHTPRGRAR